MSPTTDQAIGVPNEFQKTTGVKSLSLSASGEGSVIGTGGNNVATFTVTRQAGVNSMVFTRVGAKPVTVNFQTSQDATGNMNAKGTVNGVAFDVSVSKDGKLLSGAAPKGLDPGDAQIFEGMSRGFTALHLQQPHPIKPSPFIPIEKPTIPKTEEKMAVTTTAGGTPVDPPSRHLIIGPDVHWELQKQWLGYCFFNQKELLGA